MKSRRETPFPNRKNRSAQAVTGSVVRGPLNYNVDDSSVDSGLSTLLEDDIIDLNSSSSSSSCSVISVLDSTSASASSNTSNRTVRSLTIETPMAKKMSSPMAAATQSPQTPFVNTRRGTGGNSLKKKPLDPLPNITGQHAVVADVLRLYQTQANTELSRLEASVVKWKMMRPTSPLRTAQLKQVIAAATELLAGPATAFQQAVCDALTTVSKNAEIAIARHLRALQASVESVYADFAKIPVRTLVMSSDASEPPMATGGSVRPIRYGVPVRSFPAQQTPPPAIADRRTTPISVRSKIPVL